ncbi:hypothetical protein [Novosphingobium sp. Fuku2-ISO-50]|uniref:hypothetical protein n=1 Tax=Novosphingobium sp. Fuku2-ISO-50 TaxID=1739114 RepID=UPI0012E3626E|nr:hypothetical protein [Novosphingobium sp. Fuku2-ISO-50]
MDATNTPIDLDRLAACFTVELHIDAIPLAAVVREALRDAYQSGLSGAHLRWQLADAIEDGLGFLGDGLDRHLNDAARANWRRDCGLAFDKALRRVS